ncbi:hypothetical protein ACSBL2_16010 [Pedobacter sp. AW31-3R]|uniref:hypothetical protein n=1 Tax=Pedobacter sp. AW31-3R TaxID=3445781 RepID=UPI003F9ECFB3
MKNLTTKKSLLKLFTLPCLVLTILFTSCSKDDNDGPEGDNSYPKEVNIEYRVTSVSGITGGDVLYTNSTGGQTSVDNISLPYSVKLKRTVNQYDNLALNFSAQGNGEVKAELLVEDKVVETKNFSGTSFISGSAVYLFQ